MTLSEFIEKYRIMLDEIDKSMELPPLAQGLMLCLLTTVIQDAEKITQRPRPTSSNATPPC